MHSVLALLVSPSLIYSWGFFQQFVFIRLMGFLTIENHSHESIPLVIYLGLRHFISSEAATSYFFLIPSTICPPCQDAFLFRNVSGNRKQRKKCWI